MSIRLEGGGKVTLPMVIALQLNQLSLAFGQHPKLKRALKRYEMTLNYRMTMERYPNPNGGVDGSIYGYENFSLLDGKTKSPPTTT